MAARGLLLGAAVVCGLLLGGVTALDNGAARTPPMGWNSWNHFGCRVTGKLLQETADQLVALGLSSHYTFVNTDDCWLSATRNASGQLQADPRFGEVATTATYIRSKGLQFGIYGAAGLTTCASRAGSLYHERSDAQSYAAWGVKYLKYDDCGEVNLNSYAKFSAMRDALNATGVPILFSYEPHLQVPIAWPPAVGNAWRTGGDIGAKWSSILKELHVVNEWATVTGPGAWGDADMLEVGNAGLTVPEQRTHFALWAAVKSPLIIGSDLSKLSAASLAILKNAEIIAVNQDALGVQAVKVAASAGNTVLHGPATVLRELAHRRAEEQAAWRRTVARVAAAGVPVTACQYSGVSAAQQWQMSNHEIRQGNQCLTLLVDGRTVGLATCASQASQSWSATPNTVTQIQSTLNSHCLAFDGASLFVQPCLTEPADCHQTRCANSVLVQQMWYLSEQTKQLISSFTNTSVPPLDRPEHSSPPAANLIRAGDLINVPFCLSSAPNPDPPQPPKPPPVVDPSLPLQVWAGPLQGGDVVVALLNAQDTETANITAHWADLGIHPDARMAVRDLWAGKDLGVSQGTLSAPVAAHDTAVFRLTPAHGAAVRR